MRARHHLPPSNTCMNFFFLINKKRYYIFKMFESKLSKTKESHQFSCYHSLIWTAFRHIFHLHWDIGKDLLMDSNPWGIFSIEVSAKAEEEEWIITENEIPLRSCWVQEPITDCWLYRQASLPLAYSPPLSI